EVLAEFQTLCAAASERLSLNLAVGIARFPYLRLDRAAALENAGKALDHALLLPPPRAALFDSVSLNIAADKLFVDGDFFGALEEFKLALLADENNLTARNSLGVCLAQLGRLEQARQHFEQVIAADPKDIMAHFNLGRACQRLGDLKRAREAYRRCLKLDPRHIFSLLRLGTLAERENKPAQAEKFYLQAAELPEGHKLTPRLLARVCLARGRTEQAREYLHLALQANHNDAQAMHLLARLYLDSGEDPQIAEVLARQSSALSPDKEEYWQTLSLALAAQGKDEEARQVELRRA
ncbi:MAG TPA: diguanylate cyclase, partial [Desulfovibrio sp.]|nr:diguanylate cyclase [Desulfovibrio sp.]